MMRRMKIKKMRMSSNQKVQATDVKRMKKKSSNQKVQATDVKRMKKKNKKKKP